MEDDEMFDTREEKTEEKEESPIHVIHSGMRILKNSDNIPEGEHEECEEPGCTKPAIMDWNGFKVCNGHYNSYKAKEESLMGKGLSALKKDEEFGF